MADPLQHEQIGTGDLARKRTAVLEREQRIVLAVEAQDRRVAPIAETLDGELDSVGLDGFLR